MVYVILHITLLILHNSYEPVRYRVWGSWYIYWSLQLCRLTCYGFSLQRQTWPPEPLLKYCSRSAKVCVWGHYTAKPIQFLASVSLYLTLCIKLNHENYYIHHWNHCGIWNLEAITHLQSFLSIWCFNYSLLFKYSAERHDYKTDYSFWYSKNCIHISVSKSCIYTRSEISLIKKPVKSMCKRLAHCLLSGNQRTLLVVRVETFIKVWNCLRMELARDRE